MRRKRRMDRLGGVRISTGLECVGWPPSRPAENLSSCTCRASTVFCPAEVDEPLRSISVTSRARSFFFGNAQIRTQMINGDPWFYLVDVYRVLDIGNPSQAATHLDADEKATLTTNEGAIINGLASNTSLPTVISESGLWSLVLTSRKPEAKAFKKWLTGTVIPALWKDGGYIVGEEKVVTGEMHEDELILQAMTVLQGKAARFAIEVVAGSLCETGV